MDIKIIVFGIFSILKYKSYKHENVCEKDTY